MKLFLLLPYFLIASCAASNSYQELDAKAFYKRDMIVTINGKTREGIIIAPISDKYSFQIEARGNLDLFVMTSCHKEETKERAWNVQKIINSGLFGWGKKKIDIPNQANFDYYPTQIEKEGDCPLELSGIEAEKGRHSWAFIDFESPLYTLPALISCNGLEGNANGVYACQSRAGLKQRIIFSEVVQFHSSNPCNLLPALDEKTFDINTQKGKCVAVFASKTLPKKYFKLTLLGYENILVRAAL